MWPPLMGKGGMGGAAGGGRAGGGGGGMLRTVRRSVRGSVKDPFSQSSSTASTTSTHTYKRGKNPSDVLSLSSSTSSSPFGHPVSAPSDSEGFEWECVDGSEYERGFDFGSVPSKDEVQLTVSSLLQALNPASSSKSIEDRLAYDSDKDVPDETTSPTVMGRRVSSVGSLGTELDWIEPSLQLCNPRMLRPYGSNRVYDAFHLLQTEPCVQRMVVSLSSDKAVWDAVLNNEVVQELRKSLGQAEDSGSENQDDGSDGSDAATNILNWIFDNTKAKVMELIEKITNLVSVLFQPPEVKQATEDTNAFNRMVRASIFLSIVVLFIVVSERSCK